MMSTRALGLVLDPLDTLFFRGGRPFGTAVRAQSGLPVPQTVAGAVWTHLLSVTGFDLARFQPAAGSMRDALAAASARRWVVDARPRGPWLCSGVAEKTPNLLLPTPVHCMWNTTDKKWSIGAPLPSTAALPGYPAPKAAPNLRPVWHKRKVEKKSRDDLLVDLKTLSRLLAEDPAASAPIDPKSVYDFDDRTGIAIDPDSLTTVEGMLYGASMLVLRKGYGLYAEITVPADAEDDAKKLLQGACVPFGGEGRYVSIRVVDPVKWPRAEWPPAGRSQLIYVATPAVFQAGDRWLPDRIESSTVVGAALGKPLAFSGWDNVRRRPLPTVHAVPAGSVYFVKQNVVRTDSLCGDELAASQGFGFYLTGEWTNV